MRTIKEKRKMLYELIYQGWLDESDEKKIYEAFGYDVQEVSYLHIMQGGDYVGNTKDECIDDIIEVNKVDDSTIESAYDELIDEFGYLFEEAENETN